jgi:aryl-alcohol dehydrogenase-like predicted oxidoreductase
MSKGKRHGESATPSGTERFTHRFPTQKAAGFYRTAQSLQVSNIGLGTYLGNLDEATDRAYTEAIQTALRAGINVVDTSLNYRNQRSEIAVGTALRNAFESGELQRDEVVVCTKAGYLVPNAVPEKALRPGEIVGGMHSMAPVFLADQLERSKNNLGLDTLDVFYLHNPETQLSHIPAEEFYARIREAFAYLEQCASAGQIRYYGTATWDGYRRRPSVPEGLSLERLAVIAREIGGEKHRFRYIQLPFNFAMPEAFTLLRDGKSVLTVAAEHNISVIASASLLQARLARNLPDEIAAKLPEASTDAQRAIQFARSTPGITVALVGMSTAAHVRENAALSTIPSAPLEQYLRLYQQNR